MRKKLQQLHNEAAQKRFTTFIALLVVLLFVIGGSLQVQAQDNNTNGTPITGIESLTGCSKDQVIAAASSDNTFPDEKDKIFFLYNVKTGLLLNAGGYWGTHVSLKEYGMPLWIHIDSKNWIHLAQKFDSKDEDGEGNYMEYETGGSEPEDKGVYIDRAYLYTEKNFGALQKPPSSEEVGRWKLLKEKTTPTSYILTATVQTHLQVLIRPISITSSQPRHKATWTRTAVPW